MKPTAYRRWVPAALAALAAPTLAGGCGFEPPRPPLPCEWMDDVGETTGRTAILVDVSNSTRAAGAGLGAPDYRHTLNEVIRQAVMDRDTVSVAPFSGTVASLSWTVADRSTDWKQGNENPDNQEDRRREAEECLGEAVVEAQAAVPAAPGTDILRAVAAATEWLHQGTGAKHLVVATDGLPTTGCASLVDSDFNGDAEIEALIAACSAETAQELRADVLSGVEVTLVGIGHPAASQPVPNPAQAAWLTRLWEGFCTFQGGECPVQAAPVGRNPEEPGPPPAADVDDPVVRYGTTELRYSLPEAALFDTRRAVIREGAVPLLTELAVTLRTGATVRVEVAGFADPRGDNGSNQELSEDRAEAVATFLTANGVPNVTANGMGETNVCVDGTSFPATATSDEETQCARRVDILASRS